VRTRWQAMEDGEFGIPANDTFGFEQRESDDPTSQVRFAWTVPEKYCNSAGNLQGGVLAAFADALLGAACSAHLPEDTYPALAEMKLSILRPAGAGANLHGVGYVLKKGRRVLFVEAEIADDEGRLIAKASGTEIPAQQQT
jgi:uncharacterized protein (TIGR00369 family)